MHKTPDTKIIASNRDISKRNIEKVQHDGPFIISTATSRFSTSWKNSEITWGDLVRKLSNTTRTPETYAEYQQMTKKEQGAVKDVGGFVGGSLKGGRRKVDAVGWRQVITLDADFVKGDIWRQVQNDAVYACVMYSTHSHKADQPKVRLVIPLSRTVTPEEYVAISKKIAADIGIDMFDDTTYQPHRLMYWPSTASDAEYVFEVQDTPWLDPDEVLARYTDWRDPLEWPVSSRQSKVQQRLADKQGDPHEKAGMVGAFCRTYSIEEAIETFLSEQYTQHSEGRYSYVDGSTAGGLVLYENGKFAYSHHGTDPISGLLVNAFDLVRLHLFGDKDEEAKEGTPVSRLPSTLAMYEVAKKDQKIKMMVTKEKLAEAESDFMDDSEEEETKSLEVNNKGEVIANARNAENILQNPPFKNVLCFDAFKNTEAIKGALPWRARARPHTEHEPWLGSDDKRLQHYFGRVYDFKAIGIIENAYIEVTRQHSFHPVKNYLEATKWDGVNRMETVFIDYLGADDSPYVRAVTRKWLVAAVARIYEPGCKFDYMPVLIGPQGAGKSSLIAMLAREWFSDSLRNLEGKEAGEHLQSGWIFEMGELAAMRKSEVEIIKAFISKQTDSYRVAYDRVVSEFPRKCVFIGTTNRTDFLRDQTGNRRFWGITVEPEKRKFNAFETLTAETVAQIWAEALNLYYEGEELFLSPELEREANRIQETHVEEDPRAGLIQGYLDTLLPVEWDDMSVFDRRAYLDSEEAFEDRQGAVQRQRVCAAEIWAECLGNDHKNMKPFEATGIYNILRRLDEWEERKPARTSFKIYGKQTTFIKKSDGQ